MHTNSRAPKASVLRQCDVFEKEMVAQEILGVRPSNYTGCEKNVFKSCKGWGRNAAAKYRQSVLISYVYASVRDPSLN
jgi:hypothetical protein